MSKEQITKIAKLVAQRRQQQKLTKEAGMQKTALSAATLMKYYSRLRPSAGRKFISRIRKNVALGDRRARLSGLFKENQ